MSDMLSTTACKVIEAYGGKDTWLKAKKIEAEVSTSGWLFTLKRRPFFKHAIIKMDVHQPISQLTPIGRDPQVTGALNLHDVFLKNEKGETLQSRKKAREYFPSIRRHFRWDDLDMAYFANYAFWNYLTLPALIMRQDIEWSEVEEGVLDAEFPESIPTHSRKQRFIFNKDSWLLEQHNYTADIVGGFAKAANIVVKHSESNGVVYPSTRRVTPINFNGKALKAPELVKIEVHRFSLM